MENEFKVGTVALVGRPNVGKSTLLNALIGHKVSIVSTKPQTTRSQIVAVFEDERGQLFFTDTPGLYQGKAVGSFNQVISQSIKEADLVLYVVDQTRDWGSEDERIWHMIEAESKPVILIINKADVINHSFAKSYEIIVGKHVAKTMTLSALNQTHIQTLLKLLFELAPVAPRNTTVDNFETPLLSQSGREFLAELIREKIYETCGAEVPYQVRTYVTRVVEDESKNRLSITGYIVVVESRYKPILIGYNGKKISELTKAVKKELWVATEKDVRVHLLVATQEEYDEVCQSLL